MKTQAKAWIIAVATVFALFGILSGIWWWSMTHYVHQHCIVQTGSALEIYAADHHDKFPASTNGFGNALLLLVKSGETMIPNLCAPGDDGHVYMQALTNNSTIPEPECSRVYIQGLNKTNDPQLCILFDRNSCRGGDHLRSPWGRKLRELISVDGSMQKVFDEDWPEFSRKQVDLLVAAGFSRSNALAFYPAAKQ